MPLSKTLKIFASAVVLLAPLAFTPPHRAAEKPLRILWIGNSYTYVNELPKIISMLADSSHVDRAPAITGKSPIGLPAIGVTPAEAKRAQISAHKVLAAGK